MPLTELWKSSPQTVENFTIKQVVQFAGNGNLVDNSDCSREVRDYISQVGLPKIASYIQYCLDEPFERSGQVLQDLVNELGRRLDYKVLDGLYAGKKNAIGNDGLWIAPEGWSIVVEVKTTDAYSISLNTIAKYRQSLLSTGSIDEKSSILLVVGRQTTAELEAQIRGSRHAWDVRLVSMEALTKLAFLKLNSDEPSVGAKIRSLLIPVEYTKLDGLIDVVFATAVDIEAAPDIEVDEIFEDISSNVSEAVLTSKADLSQMRQRLVAAASRYLGSILVKRSRATWWSADHTVRICCSLSKRYGVEKAGYWYAYHPDWDEFLADGSKSYYVLGLADRAVALIIPHEEWVQIYPSLHSTMRDGKVDHWHVRVESQEGGSLVLQRSKLPPLPLSDYVVSIED